MPSCVEGKNVGLEPMCEEAGRRHGIYLTNEETTVCTKCGAQEADKAGPDLTEEQRTQARAYAGRRSNQISPIEEDLLANTRGRVCRCADVCDDRSVRTDSLSFGRAANYAEKGKLKNAQSL